MTEDGGSVPYFLKQANEMNMETTPAGEFLG
jgi:hypothetical protein